MAEKRQRDFKKRDDKFAGRDRDRNRQSRAPRDAKPREAKTENIVDQEVAVDEKGFDKGGSIIRDKGIRVESLAVIKKMTDDSIEFED